MHLKNILTEHFLTVHVLKKIYNFFQFSHISSIHCSQVDVKLFKQIEPLEQLKIAFFAWFLAKLPWQPRKSLQSSHVIDSNCHCRQFVVLISQLLLSHHFFSNKSSHFCCSKLESRSEQIYVVFYWLLMSVFLLCLLWNVSQHYDSKKMPDIGIDFAGFTLWYLRVIRTLNRTLKRTL